MLVDRDQGHPKSSRQKGGAFVQSKLTMGSGGTGRSLAGQTDDGRDN